MLKVLTYNIHKGVCYYSRKVVLQELRECLRRVDPDLIFLQEVCGHSARNSLGPQFDFLAEQIWPHVSYGKNAIYSNGHHGNAILSKFPIQFNENLDISNHRLERRGLLHARVEVPRYGQMSLFCLHLDLLEVGRARQVDRITARIQDSVDAKEPVILAGDFNDWRLKISDRLHRSLGLDEAGMYLHGRHAKTFPSLRPTLALDRIYFRGLQLREHRVLRGGDWHKLSDHLAVAAQFARK